MKINDVRSIVQIQVNTIRTEADVHASLFNVSQTMLERLAVIAEAPARKQESSQHSVFLMSYHGASDRYLPLLGLQFDKSLTKLHHPEDSNPQTFKPHTVHESVISENINSNAGLLCQKNVRYALRRCYVRRDDEHHTECTEEDEIRIKLS